jgi:hypothetical protein
MRVTLICYADGAAVHAANRALLVRSARQMGIDSILACSGGDLDENFRREHRHILERRRGAGYWLWKPYLIRECLRGTDPGDVVCYLDAGLVVRRHLGPLIRQAEEHDLLAFRGSRPNRLHVKRDCFVLTGTDVPACHDAAQIDASTLLLKNTAANQAFVESWLRYCADARILTDQPNECGAPNLPGFIDHRHDQAVLSVLLWRERDRLQHVVCHQRVKRAHLLHHRRRWRVPILVWLHVWPCWKEARRHWRRLTGRPTDRRGRAS